MSEDEEAPTVAAETVPELLEAGAAIVATEPTRKTNRLAREPQPVPIDQMVLKAIQKGDVETVERIVALKERMDDRLAKARFNEALGNFQYECPIIPKTKEVKGAYSYRYASLADILLAVQELMHKHGLSYSFDTGFESDPPAMLITCTISHVAGHSKTSFYRTQIDPNARMNTMQQGAAAQTYGKRYAFCNALGIMTGDEDNDGRTAPTPATPDAPRRSDKPDPSRPNDVPGPTTPRDVPHHSRPTSPATPAPVTRGRVVRVAPRPEDYKVRTEPRREGLQVLQEARKDSHNLPGLEDWSPGAARVVEAAFEWDRVAHPNEHRNLGQAIALAMAAALKTYGKALNLLGEEEQRFLFNGFISDTERLQTV